MPQPDPTPTVPVGSPGEGGEVRAFDPVSGLTVATGGNTTDALAPPLPPSCPTCGAACAAPVRAGLSPKLSSEQRGRCEDIRAVPLKVRDWQDVADLLAIIDAHFPEDG